MTLQPPQFIDLMSISTQPYIRMSSTDNCRHAIAHMIVGTPQRQRGFNDIAMRMGTALEPMIVHWLADHGVLCYFTGDEQLEVGLEDPYRVGHLDGIIGLDTTVEVDYWVRHNFPQRALDILSSGQCMMLEAKTMNEDAFEKFKREGIAGGTFTKKYRGQANSYLAALSQSSNDEVWPDHEVTLSDGTKQTVYGSGTYKALLRTHGWQRPTAVLMVVLCPGTKQFAFEFIEFDDVQHTKRTAELAVIPEYLHRGEMPPPDFDGQAADCFFCYYAYVCPAVQVLTASRIIDDIPIVLEDNAQEIEELAAAYQGINEEIKSLESRKKELRDDLERRTMSNRVVTPGYLVTLSDVKGRRGLDTDQVRKDYESLGKEMPYKTGRPYKRLTVIPLYGPSARDTDTD